VSYWEGAPQISISPATAVMTVCRALTRGHPLQVIVTKEANGVWRGNVLQPKKTPTGMRTCRGPRWNDRDHGLDSRDPQRLARSADRGKTMSALISHPAGGAPAEAATKQERIDFLKQAIAFNEGNVCRASELMRLVRSRR
jgi:hypothetical protein